MLFLTSFRSVCITVDKAILHSSTVVSIMKSVPVAAWRLLMRSLMCKHVRAVKSAILSIVTRLQAWASCGDHEGLLNCLQCLAAVLQALSILRSMSSASL